MYIVVDVWKSNQKWIGIDYFIFHFSQKGDLKLAYTLADSGSFKSLDITGVHVLLVSLLVDQSISHFFLVDQKTFCIKVAWSLQFLGYLRTLRLKFQSLQTTTKIGVFLTLPS